MGITGYLPCFNCGNGNLPLCSENLENYPHQIFYITYMIIHIYYPGEPVNIHIQSLINIIKENNRVITTKKG